MRVDPADFATFSSFKSIPGACIPRYRPSSVDEGCDLKTVHKFYVVTKASEPGIYTVWRDCVDTCRGASGNNWLLFNSAEEAFVYWQKECVRTHCRHSVRRKPVDPAPSSDSQLPGQSSVPPSPTSSSTSPSTPKKATPIFAFSSPIRGRIAYADRSGAEAALLSAAERGEKAALGYVDSLDDVSAFFAHVRELEDE
ncbi:hypothetical protein C8J56DRAFT_1049992 [Mycena floridula]|nr:hypothetical protein C8J56DRAFT_1049992 [Mycena floridula]